MVRALLDEPTADVSEGLQHMMGGFLKLGYSISYYASFNQHRCDSRRITYSFALGGARLLLIMEHTRAELHVSICPLNWRCQSIKTRKGSIIIIRNTMNTRR